MSDFPSPDSHTVWIATTFQVEVETPDTAAKHAQHRLAAQLDHSLLLRAEGRGIGCSAVRFDEIARVAISLLARENKGGVAAERIRAFRAEARQAL